MTDSYFLTAYDKEKIEEYPRLESFIRESEKVLKDAETWRVFLSQFKEFSFLIDEMGSYYKYGIRFFERSDELDIEARSIEENFEKIAQSLQNIKKCCDSESEKNILKEEVEHCVKTFFELVKSFDNLEEMEKNGKTYSDSPFINDLIRVGNLVLAGKLPPFTLRERVESLIQLLENFFFNIDSMEATKKEKQALKSHRSEINKAFSLLIQGLKEILIYFEDSNQGRIQVGMQKAKRAAENILNLEKIIEQARNAPEVKSCLRCGAESPINVTYCLKCRFKFPDLGINDTSEMTLDLCIDEGDFGVRGKSMTENIQTIITAVEEVRVGKITIEEYLQVLEFYNDLIINVSAESEKLKVPNFPNDPTGKENFKEFASSFYEGLNDLRTGIEILFEYTQTKNQANLDEGLSVIRTGADSLFDVYMGAEHLKLKMHQ